jgi:hypothetical protein
MGTTTFSGPVVSQAGFITGTDAVAASVTASTLAVTDAYNGATIPLNRAAGQAVTLPAASGSQAVYTFYIGTTISSNSTTIKVANSTDIMQGALLSVKATSGSTQYNTVSDSDTITLNGTTTGGIVGSYIQVKDIASGYWVVTGVLQASGVLATPFSASV